MKFGKAWLYSFLIILFHVVGFIGFLSSDFEALFKQIVPFHLVLMLVLTLLSHQDKSKEFWAFIVTTYAAGYIIEFAGVHTGLIFGSYSYGDTLGLKLFNIPLMIGVNWILVLYSVGSFVQVFNIKNKLAAAMVGAFLLTALDFFIEPVAIKYDYWHWYTNMIPAQNFVAWFLFSFGMLSMAQYFKFDKNNPVGITLFITQVLFFIALNLSL